jgi:predicted N-acetyltransferase YhbS
VTGATRGFEEATTMTTHDPIMTDLTLRRARPDDAQECGRICFEAFQSIANRHNYPMDFPVPEFSVGITSYLISHPKVYGVVAERDGRIVGSNFLDERSTIAGVGPITVDPTTQDRGVGRRLMQDILDRAASQRFAGVRLVQAAYHTRSLALYASLGFEVREPLACVQGPPLGMTLPGRSVRTAHEADLEACNRLCRSVHGHDRGGELQEAMRSGMTRVVEHGGAITGYATALAFFGHAVGETDDDVKALIGAAPSFEGPGILVPARSPLLRWCLDNNLRLVQVMTLMSVGLYNEPRGAFLPSILY